MSATCPNSPHRPVDASRALSFAGFTLLELIVVVMLISVVTALAAPNLHRLYGAVARTTERNEILNRFANLGRQAMLHRRAYLVVGTDTLHEKRRKSGGTAMRLDEEDVPFSEYVSPLEHHEPYRMDVPDGWTLHLPVPILVRANGVCLGGEVALFYHGEPDIHLVLEPPYCHVDA